MSQHIQQVVSVPANQVIQGQIVQGQATGAQMVMNNQGNLNAISQQQIVTQLVTGQTVQGSIATNSVGATTLTAGQVQEMQQMIASSSAPGIQHVITGQQVEAAQSLSTVQQVVQNQNPSNITQIKLPQTQSVPPPVSSVNLSDNPPPVISKQRMSELVQEIDTSEQLDEDVEELLMTIADDFIESTVNAACKLAKHRGSRSLDVKDVQMYLERNWHMWIPGYGTDELKPYKRAPTTEAHKQRLALLRKAVKKY